jgi:serine/threonine-protein kinase
MVQVYIPAGSFKMGNREEIMLAECQKYRRDCLSGFYREMEPMHIVTLEAFWIDRTEVTNAMYALCVKDGHCRQPDDFILFDQPDYYDLPEFANYPVLDVTWEDARAYCAWAGRRLPTEAEWEKAARGTDGRLYPWGNEQVTGNRDNFCDVNCQRSYQDTRLNDGYAVTAPVGSYPDGASPYGVLDMAGNLREWTSSLYLPYPYRSDDGREELTVGGYRVVRGGHWDGTTDFGLSAYRFEDRPEYHSSCVGFRCASSP